MKVVFFGSSGAVQTAANTNVCFAVRAEGLSLLVDASGSPVQNLKRAQLDPLGLDALVVTHAHTDHLYAVPSLIHNLWLMKRDRPFTIVANPQTLARVQELLDVLGLLKKEGLFAVRWVAEADGELGLGSSAQVKLFPVLHSVPTSGIRVEAPGCVFVYSADTAPCSRIAAECRGSRALIHEASGPASQEQQLNRAGHSSARQAAETAAEAGVERLYLCHFDDRPGATPDEMRGEARDVFAGEVIVPELFLWYEI
jgi:ribonuclease Z